MANRVLSADCIALAIDPFLGPSSSGQTTFAKRLQVQLEAFGYKPFVLSVDSFYKAIQEGEITTKTRDILYNIIYMYKQ